MHSSPWNFRNWKMEERFRLEYVEGTMERLAPALFVLMPYLYLSFMSLAIIRYNSMYVWSFGEVFITVTRIIFTIIATVLYFLKWTSLFGKSFLWMHRMGYILTIFQQSGVHQHDASFRVLVIWLLYFGGAVTPSFMEYLFSSFVISFTKSFRLWTFESICENRADFECTDDGKQQEFLHASILFGMAVFINYHLYGDYRRSWLLRCANLGKSLRSACKATTCDVLELQWDLHQRRIADPNGELDILADGYYSDADRALLRDTVRAEAAEIVAAAEDSPPPDRLKPLLLVGAGSLGFARLAAVRCDWADRVVRKALRPAPGERAHWPGHVTAACPEQGGLEWHTNPLVPPARLSGHRH